MRLLVLCSFFIASLSFAATNVMTEEALTKAFQQNYNSKFELQKLKTLTLEQNNKAVPVLIKVMKESSFPEQNRWVATFLLGQIMGEKSAPFIAKFVAHPHWMMRLAALKTLLHLKQKDYHNHYAQALRDPSLLVRYQALENIERMKISALGPQVWKMLYNKDNYSGKEGKLKRASIMKNVIRTLGDIEFKEAAKPMQAMLVNKHYKDLHEDLRYSLAKLK
jgi:hypothetical protein